MIGDRAKCISLNGAPSQYDRYLGSEDEAVRVDDRPEAQLLAFSVEFGRLLKFYNLQDVPDGDWSGFFLSDPTIALASVVALDLRGLQEAFTARENAVLTHKVKDRKAAALADCFHWLLDLALQFNGWLAGMERLFHSPSARMFSTEIRHLVTRELGAAIRRLERYSKESPAREALADSPLSFSEFLPVWSLGGDLPGIHAPQERQEEPGCDAVAAALRTLLVALLAAAQRLREYALRHMADSLTESDHQPPAALYIAFVHLFRSAQRSVNRVTPRFAHFYYLDVLRSGTYGSRAETVYLTATVAGDFSGHATAIARGTRFSSAGSAAAPSVTYAARQDVPVSSATLKVVRALRVVPGSLCEGDPSTPVPARIMASAIDVDLMNPEALEKSPGTAPLAWPTFGATSPGVRSIAAAAPAAIGMAIASPYLMLTGGTRDISVTFQLAPFSAELTSTLDELAAASGLSQAQVLVTILNGAFDIVLSTSGAWFEAPPYRADYTPSSPEVPAASFSVTWSLPPSAPPVLAFGPPPDQTRLDAPGSDTASPAPLLPTVKFRLRQTPVTLPAATGEKTVSTYPLSTLRLAAIVSMALGTTTRELTNLDLQNTNGPVDTSSPFPFFGAAPVTGSWLRVSNPELFVKVPSSLTLAIEWYALPGDREGFQGYYQDYIRDMNGRRRPGLFNNSTFRCRIDVRKPGLWKIPGPEANPDPASQQLYLFTTVEGETCAAVPAAIGKLCPSSTFRNLPIQPETGFDFYDPADTALQVTLTDPGYAFGNLLYAPNVLNAVIDDLPPPAGSTSETTPEEAAKAPRTQALRAAVDSLSSVAANPAGKSSGLFRRSAWSPGWARKNDQDRYTAAVRNWQANVLSEVRTYLEQNLVPVAGTAGAQVQSILASAPAGTVQEQARTLNDALTAAAPQLPPATEGVADIASVVLEGVAAADQALQNCVSEDAGQYKACIQSGLAAIQAELDRALDAMTAAGAAKLRYPNPPWLPQASSVSVSYTAGCSVPLARGADASFYYLLPFGGYQTPAAGVDSVPLLPVPDYSGQLILGLSSLEVPQILNVLFQMTAGGHRNPPAVFWEYLAQTWIRFQDSEEPVDTTDGLQQTGVVSLSVPAPSPDPQTIAPAGLRWFRAVVSRSGTLDSPDLFPETSGIFLNPILADQVSDNAGDPAEPTPAHTVKKPIGKLHGVGRISQPAGSFGGRPQESYDQLRSRQAERLRHKDRAVLPWDYERLVLQAFPAIWKVMALCATGIDSGAPGLSRDPGSVLVMVVAGPSAATKDTTKPLATARTLEQITQFLVARASVFARIHVINPNYIAIQVDASVSFTPGEDPGAGIDKLDSDLVQYLSPWFYDESRAQKGGDYASEDAIVQFIVTRSYIAALDDILFDYEGACAAGWCFYTSAPKHRIRQSSPVRKPAAPLLCNG